MEEDRQEGAPLRHVRRHHGSGPDHPAAEQRRGVREAERQDDQPAHEPERPGEAGWARQEQAVRLRGEREGDQRRGPEGPAQAEPRAGSQLQPLPLHRLGAHAARGLGRAQRDHHRTVAALQLEGQHPARADAGTRAEAHHADRPGQRAGNGGRAPCFQQSLPPGIDSGRAAHRDRGHRTMCRRRR